MNRFYRLATRIDQQTQQLVAEGISDAHAAINRMMGYVPDLRRIWISTSDQQLIALFRESPGFYCYARITEEAFDAGRNRTSRPYDDMAELSEQHKEMGAQLLATANTLEHGYQTLRAGGNLQAFQPHPRELGRLYRQWLFGPDSFKNSLRAQDAEPKVLEYANDAFSLMVERIKQFVG